MRPKLVFVIHLHDVFGVVISPFMVSQTVSGDFSLSFKRINFVTVDDYFPECSDEERSVVKLLDECRDEELMKKFSQKSRSASEFFDNLEESRLRTLVLPFIQKRFDRCLGVLQREGIPLYFKGEKSDFIKSKPVYIKKGAAQVVFNFIKNSDSTHYYLKLLHEKNSISLKDSNSYILVNDPGWVLISGALYLLEKGVDGSKLKPFFVKDHILVPGSAEKKYYSSFVSNAIKKYKVRTRGIEIIEETPDPLPVLSLENDLSGNPVVALWFTYNQKKCCIIDANDCWVEMQFQNGNYSFQKIIRARGKEASYSDKLIKMGLESRDSHLFYLPGYDFLTRLYSEGFKGSPLYSLVEWISENLEGLQKCGFYVKQQFFKKIFYTGEIKVVLNLNDTKDWFDIKGYIVFDKFKIPFLKFKDYLLGGKREYTLPDGRIAILPEDWFSKYEALLTYGKGHNDELKLERHHFTIINNLDSAGNSKSAVFRLSDKTNLSVPEIPDQLAGKLRSYQLAGYAWMYFLFQQNLGGCLADDMGLGKTVQTLALLLKLKNEGVGRKLVDNKPVKQAVQLDLFNDDVARPGRTSSTSLIVMPLSLIHNWENEILKFTPGLSFISYTGGNRASVSDNIDKYDIVLTTYGIVRNDLQFLKGIKFFYLILDESQVIKNPGAKVTRAVRQLDSIHRIILTGTPIENSLMDLWSQLSFLNPGILGGQRFFSDRFLYPIEKNNCESKRKQLKKIIEPFILRRTKKLVEKDLPELSEKIYYCEMTPEQRRLYESKKSEIRNSILATFDKGVRRDINICILKGLIELRLLANHPSLAGGVSGDSGKFDEVARSLESLIAEGHKVLVFSQFVKHLNIYSDYFKKRNWKFSFLSGRIKERERIEAIERFQLDSETLLFLISLKAGGVGLNLTAADYIIILDPWWNPAVEAQAVSRAHRIGQNKPVMSYRFITKDTVEERILNLQQKKSDLARDFVSINDPFKLFTDKEIMDLFE